MISSNSVRGLLELNQDAFQEQPLTPIGEGISIKGAIQDMVTLLSVSDLYDDHYLKDSNLDGLIDIVRNDTRDLTLTEIDTLIKGLGTRLFLSFMERQTDARNAEAWDKGVGHTVEVRNRLQSLRTLTDTLTDDPLEGRMIGDPDGQKV